MRKEVICIDDNWQECTCDYCKKNQQPRVKKGDILTACELIFSDNRYYYSFEELNNSENRYYYYANNFADITSLTQEIIAALKAPSPDYRPEKLSPAEKEWAKGPIDNLDIKCIWTRR